MDEGTIITTGGNEFSLFFDTNLQHSCIVQQWILIHFVPLMVKDVNLATMSANSDKLEQT